MPAPKYAAKVDENQKQIVRDLKKLGVCVQDLSAVGGGCPDLVTSYKGKTLFVEIKNPKRYGKQRQLQNSQVKWRDEWQGDVIKAETVNEIADALGIKTILRSVEDAEQWAKGVRQGKGNEK